MSVNLRVTRAQTGAIGTQNLPSYPLTRTWGQVAPFGGFWQTILQNLNLKHYYPSSH